MAFAANLLQVSEVPPSYWGEVDPQLWFEMTGCEGRHFLVDGSPHILGRLYAYCPATQAVTRISKSDIIASSDAATYFLRGYLSGSEPPPPTDDEGMLIEDQAVIDEWVAAVEVWRDTGRWTIGD